MERNLREIADHVGGEVIGDDQVLITAINSLDKASRGEISFLFDRRYEDQAKETKASAVIVSTEITLYRGSQIVVSNPRLAYARVAEIFMPPMSGFPGISSDAVIDETSSIGENVSIYPMVYVGKEAAIGDNVTLFPGTFIGERVRIGDRTILYPNVSVLHDSIIGSDVIIHAGCVIGSDGFGFVRDGARNVKIPQLGIVQIDDHVEIGANSCIDRSALGKTWIKKGVKTDNLVQIAHNVEVGEDTIIVALTGISGSVQIGRGVVIGGQVGIGDHLKIGDGAMIASASGVNKSVLPGEVVSGNPIMPHRHYLRTRGLIKRLPQFNDRLRSLEKKLEKLEKLLK
ncbi:UDP-3-O-(3-hydroxymyristoyl)glucosamine N-acyltransferase [Thermodesulfobacteriota bacterium]